MKKHKLISAGALAICSLEYLFGATSLRAEGLDTAAFVAALNRRAPIAELRHYYRRPSFPPAERQKLGNREPMVALGRKLFFDPRISESGKLSCATCHNPVLHWVDGNKHTTESAMRSMQLENLAWDSIFTWQGRATTMSSQAILAMEAPSGMGMSRSPLELKLSQLPEYRLLFEAAYGGSIPEKHLFSADTVSHALERFLSSVVSAEAPFDRWINGDESALSEEAKSGFELFNGRANCARCHSGWRLSDGQLHDIGMSLPNQEGARLGTRNPFVFKAVGLRNIAKRPPYMHDGRFDSLAEVIDFYERGGDLLRNGKSAWVRPIKLSPAERQSLIAFLETLG